MKTTLSIWLVCLAVPLLAQRHQDQKTLRDQLNVDANVQKILIENINGDVTVSGHTKNHIEYEVVVKAKSRYEDEVELAMKELDFKSFVKGGKMYLTMDAPFIEERWEGDNRYGRNIHDGPDYDFEYMIKVKVPAKGYKISASTINNGYVKVSGIESPVSAINVNGDVEIESAVAVRKAHTVNGNVDVRFTSAPNTDGSYHTINGNITLMMPDKVDAVVYSKSMHGDLFSAYDFEYTKLDLEVNERKRNGTVYTVGSKTGIKLGKGGPQLDLETLNGNMYLKKL